jgi:hypothetical protein
MKVATETQINIPTVRIKEYHVAYERGLSILFEINGFEFRRVSILATKQLLWWKNEKTLEYCSESQAHELESIVKNFLKAYKFREQKQISV